MYFNRRLHVLVISQNNSLSLSTYWHTIGTWETRHTNFSSLTLKIVNKDYRLWYMNDKLSPIKVLPT